MLESPLFDSDGTITQELSNFLQSFDDHLEAPHSELHLLLQQHDGTPSGVREVLRSWVKCKGHEQCGDRPFTIADVETHLHSLKLVATDDPHDADVLFYVGKVLAQLTALTERSSKTQRLVRM